MNDPLSPSYDEISLVDILCFFQRRFRLIGGLTLLGILLGLGFHLSRPPRVQQALVLSLTTPYLQGNLLTPTPKSASSVSLEDPLANELAGVWEALSLEKNLSLETFEHNSFRGGELSTAPFSGQAFSSEQVIISLTTRVDEFSIVMESSQSSVLEELPSLAVETFEAEAQRFIHWNLNIAASNLSQKIEESQYVIDSLIAQDVRLPATNDTVISDEIARTARLEFQHQAILTTQTVLDNIIKTEVIESKQSTINRSLFSITILLTILGLVVSTFIAICVDQWPRLKQQWQTRTEDSLHTEH